MVSLMIIGKIGLNAAFKTVFPIMSYSGNASLEYISYSLGKPVFDVHECKLRGQTYAAPMCQSCTCDLRQRC